MSGPRPTDAEIAARVAAAGPWYHDFRRLGLDTTGADASGPVALSRHLARLLRERLSRGARLEKGGRLLSRASLRPVASHRVNQRHKEEVLLPWLERELDRLPATAAALDLFCADGYYSCTMAACRPGLDVTGIDLDGDELERARLAAELLGLDRVRFERAEAAGWISASAERFDVVLCAGGLYHLDDPRPLLAALRGPCRGRLVLQSVVSLEHEDAGYFEAPAPGWRHGCRFSHAWLEDRLTELGWRTEERARNELTGNRRPADRGSSYFLCRPV